MGSVPIFTAPNSCGKVMFSQVCVLGRHPPPGADGTHPTGMHSCFNYSPDTESVES